MKLFEGMTLCGFSLNSIREVPSIQSIAYIFSHEKTGARLLKLFNRDDNKVFSIVFKTPPQDNTGVPHILEHSVLAGSRKYPTKEPFVELLKSSLHTFLNAMTFPDKTMYPVASKNEKDFLNLIDVYLDAVFFPNIYHNPFILMQEGWHYEFDSKGRLIINGIVYNEMKGAFSSPERIIVSKIQKLLFPDTCYAFESGGDPEEIPSLTQEMFLNFHQTYYHPSNSYIYLYGNGNVERELSLIDSYLSEFSTREIDIPIFPQKPFDSPIDRVFEYPISKSERTNERSYVAVATASGVVTDPVLYLGYEIVRHLLLGTAASPLKKNLLKAKIAKDITAFAELEILQPYLCVIAKKTDPQKKNQFIEIIRETLGSLVTKSIPRDMIEASINHIEFQLREAEHPNIPRGLLYHFISMASWLYCDDPLVHLDFLPTLEKIRTYATNRFFENFIHTHILSTSHTAVVTLMPKPGLAEERESKETQKLFAFLSTLSDDQKKLITDTTDELKRRQRQPDSPEALAKLPYLTLADIPLQQEPIPFETILYNRSHLLFPDVATNGIAYVHFYFDIRFPYTMLPYVGLLAGILGKIRTKKRSYEELATLINLCTGGIECYTESFSFQSNAFHFTPRFVLRGKSIHNKIPHMMDLIKEILFESDLCDRERLCEIIKEIKTRFEKGIVEKGHAIAMKRLFSYFSPVDTYDDAVSGFSFYQFISTIEKQLDQRIDEIAETLQKILNQLISQQNLLVCFTVDSNLRKDAQNSIVNMLNEIPNTIIYDEFPSLALEARNEALIVGHSQVQYIAKGSNFISKSWNFSGNFHVLATILRLEYLWNRIRVLGGAYGAFVTIKRNGNFAFASYRDPQLLETIHAFNAAASFLREFSADHKAMTRYIIGTIAQIDKHLTPREKGEKAARMFLSGITNEMLQKEREEVLTCTARKIVEFSELVELIVKDEYLCVIGNETSLQKHKSLFKNFVHVM
ncbi:MAG: insulinase family protein [Spirochaetes bacterium]|nr:insulinase family protein [Spirochaetota bacterium]